MTAAFRFLFTACIVVSQLTFVPTTTAQEESRRASTMYGVFGDMPRRSAVTLLHMIDRTTGIELEGLPKQQRHTIDLLRTSYRLEESTEDVTRFVVVIQQADRQAIGNDGKVESTQQISGLRGLEIRIETNNDGSEPRITNEGPVFMRLAQSDPRANEMIVGVYSPEALLATISKPFWLVPFVDRGRSGRPVRQSNDKDGSNGPDSKAAPESPADDGEEAQSVSDKTANTSDVVSLGPPGELRFDLQLIQKIESPNIIISGSGTYAAGQNSDKQRLRIRDVKIYDLSYSGKAVLLSEPDEKPLPGRILIRPNTINWFQSLTVDVNYSGEGTVQTSAGNLVYRFQQKRQHSIQSAPVYGGVAVPEISLPPRGP